MRIFIFLLLFGFASLFVFPHVSSAALGDPLVPCDGITHICQACDIVKLGSNIITWLIGIMATVCAIVVAVAGFKMVTSGGDSGSISEARGMITNVVIGFIILLSAWLIVDTIMKMFVQDSGFGPWNEITCVDQDFGQAPPPPPPPGTTLPGGAAVTQYSCAGTNASNCVPVSSTGVPTCAGGSGTRIIDPAYASVLTGVGGGWCASSIGLESGHSNPCHTTYANCIDAKCASGGVKKDCSATEASNLQAAFKSQGLWPIYELPPGTSDATLQTYRNQGVCAYIEPASTGGHFSVYVSRDSGSGQFNKAGCV